jgi:hypothetical protein
MDRTVAHNDLVKLIRDYLSIMGIWNRKLLGSMGQADLPDILGAIPASGGLAYLLMVECKTGAARLTEGQRRVRDDVEACGGLYIEARSLEDVKTCLEELGLARPCRIG